MRTRRLNSRCTLLALVAAAVLGSAPSLAAEPSQRIMRVGFISPHSPSTDLRGVDAFSLRLRELGWVEGQNLVVERYWAENRIDRLPELMAEVVGHKVDVIITYSTPAAIAAKRATSTIPIVVAIMGDPVGTGEAQSLARPGGNLTGLSLGYADIAGKWLELLQETVPGLSTAALISNPDNPVSVSLAKELAAIAPTLRLEVRVLDVSGPDALEGALKRARREAQAVIMLPDPVSVGHRQKVAALAARYRLPAIYYLRDFVDAGGLMAYAPDSAMMFWRAAEFVGKILKGAKPAQLPVEQPTQYVLVINLKAAKAIGLTFPESILLRADDVIR
jgi:putative tryptophan/tyrosine transport system substrate-binding protein